MTKRLAALLCVVILAAAAPERAGATFTFFDSCSHLGALTGITGVPDGTYYFNLSPAVIGRLEVNGSETRFTPPGPPAELWGIAYGADGRIWAADRLNNRILAMTTAGVFTPFPLVGMPKPQNIMPGTGNTLLFTTTGSINEITTAGVVTPTPVPGHETKDFSSLTVANGSYYIGYISLKDPADHLFLKVTPGPGGTIVTPFPTPNRAPVGVTTAPNGNVYFALSSNPPQRIVEVTSGGTTTNFDLPSNTFVAGGITAAPDSSIWFTAAQPPSPGKMALGRLTTTGPGSPQVTVFPTPFQVSPPPSALTRGSDGFFYSGAFLKIFQFNSIFDWPGAGLVGPNSPILLDTDDVAGPSVGDTNVIPVITGPAQLTVKGPQEDGCDPNASNVVILSNPQPVTGQFQTHTRGSVEVTSSGYTADNRPTVFTGTDTGAVNRTGQLTLLDPNGDAIYTAFQVNSPGYFTLVSDLVLGDANSDGRADNVTIPWAAFLAAVPSMNPLPLTTVPPPQPFVPLAESNTPPDGRRTVVTDLDGNGQADPGCHTGPDLTPGDDDGQDFHTVTPTRVFDTRDPPGPTGGPPLGNGQQRIFTMTGVAGIPSGATAVAGNITVTNPGGLGHLTIYPTGSAPPGSSTINFRQGRTLANNVIVPLSQTGQFTVDAAITSGTVDVIFDVTGYFAPGPGSPGTSSKGSGAAGGGTKSPGLPSWLALLTLAICPIVWRKLKPNRD